MAVTPVEKKGIRFDPALVENWLDYLCGPNCERFIEDGPDSSPLRFFKVFLHLIAQYPPPVDGHLDYARQYFCQRCREALDARALPDRLDKWWEKLKAMAKDKVTAIELE